MGLRKAGGERLKPEEMAFIKEIWIFGADHELTHFTSALLHAAFSLADPISGAISAFASSYGPLHFGAAESAYRLMQRIGTSDKVSEAIAQHRAGKQGGMGIGHKSV